jgi:hypothetical protein
VTLDYVQVYTDTGKVALDSGRYSAIEVDSFTKGYKTIKVSYTYGNSAPTDFVKNLCAMMVLQQLRPEESQSLMIETRISLLRANSMSDI